MNLSRIRWGVSFLLLSFFLHPALPVLADRANLPPPSDAFLVVLLLFFWLSLFAALALLAAGLPPALLAGGGAALLFAYYLLRRAEVATGPLEIFKPNIVGAGGFAFLLGLLPLAQSYLKGKHVHL